MLDFGLNGLLSLIVKGPFRVELMAESKDLMSWISCGEIPSGDCVGVEEGVDLAGEGGVEDVVEDVVAGDEGVLVLVDSVC